MLIDNKFDNQIKLYQLSNLYVVCAKINVRKINGGNTFLNYIVEYPESAFFYFLLLIFSVLFAFLAQVAKGKISKVFVAVVVLILSIPSGLRDKTVGFDTYTYLKSFESAKSDYLGEMFYKYFEKGFQILIKLLVFLVGEPQYVLLIIAFITNCLIISTLWHFRGKASFCLTTFLFFTMHYFEIYNTSRQWLAISIIFFAVRYLFQSRYLPYTILVAIAATFHASALVCLSFIPLHMFVVKKSPLKYRLLLIIAAALFVLFFNNIIDVLGLTAKLNGYNQYFGNKNKAVDFGYYFVLRLFMIIIAVWLLVKKKYIFDDMYFVKSIIIISFLGTGLAIVGYFYFFAGRISYYATIFEILLLAMICKSRPFSILLKVVVTILGLILLYKGLSGSTQGQMPYKLFTQY